MYKSAIFDLDNCLAPATEVGEELYASAFDAIAKANRGTISSSSLADAFSDCWRHPLDWVARRHGFSDEMLAAGWRIFRTLEVKKDMHGYDDIGLLSRLPVQRFLVTSGFRRLQESKIRALGLEPKFDAIFVDAIDEPQRKGKEGLFSLIREANHLRPEEVVVVGDNPDSEIEAGNRLGMITVQILRPGVGRTDDAQFHIRSLDELQKLLESHRA